MNEQTGILIRGSLTFRIGDETAELAPGLDLGDPGERPALGRRRARRRVADRALRAAARRLGRPRAARAAPPASFGTPRNSTTLSSSTCPGHAASASASPRETGSRSSSASTTRAARETPRQQGAKALAVYDGDRRDPRGDVAAAALDRRRATPSDADAICAPARGRVHAPPPRAGRRRPRRGGARARARAARSRDLPARRRATIDDDADPLDAVLELLPDVPAGKLAIAQVDVASRDEVLALERAGIDAVLVPRRPRRATWSATSRSTSSIGPEASGPATIPA